MKKNRVISTTEEMNYDFEEIRTKIEKTSGKRPSNPNLMNILMQTYKYVNPTVKRKPKSKKEFIVKL